MPFCHFSRVYNETSWQKLRKQKHLQKINNCKKLEYIELITISVSQSKFNLICKDISKPHSCYQKYAALSLADLNGIWRCIIINNAHDRKNLILYTAGRSYPLYAAISE